MNGKPGDKTQKDIVYTKISFVGYSLGGLWCRFAIGEFYRRDIFLCPNKKDNGANKPEWLRQQLSPEIYTTFATPHLGNVFQGSKPRARFFNVLGSSLLGYSGQDLFLVPAENTVPNGDWILENDAWKGKSLLSIMSDPESVFFKGLKQFRERIIYANAVNDLTVPFHTGYMSLQNPFRKSGHVLLKMVTLSSDSKDLSNANQGDSVIDENTPLAKDLKTEGNIRQVVVDVSRSRYIAHPFTIDKDDKQKGKSSSNSTPSYWGVLTTLVVLGPIVFPIVILVSGIATLFSSWRVRNLKGDTAGGIKEPAVVPRKRRNSLKEEIAEATGRAIDDYVVETDSTEVEGNSAVERDEEEIDETDDNYNLESGVPLFDKSVPYLNLSEDVKQMYFNLNGNGSGTSEANSNKGLIWDKRMVYLYRFNTHSEIINRMNFKNNRGRYVVQDWVKSISSKL